MGYVLVFLLRDTFGFTIKISKNKILNKITNKSHEEFGVSQRKKSNDKYENGIYVN